MAADNLNLSAQRSQPSVWDKPQPWHATKAIVAPEQWLTAILGCMVAVYGLTRRTAGGLTASLAGGALAYRAASGHNDARTARCWAQGRLRERGWGAADLIEDASHQSFPASDAPSFTATAPARPVS